MGGGGRGEGGLTDEDTKGAEREREFEFLVKKL